MQVRFISKGASVVLVAMLLLLAATLNKPGKTGDRVGSWLIRRHLEWLGCCCMLVAIGTIVGPR